MGTLTYEIITDEEEFVEAMRNRRNTIGISGEECDKRGGVQDGYTIKLENPGKPWGRHCFHHMLWKWLRGVSSVIILVPAKQALFTDKCPCCGSRVEQRSTSKAA